MIKAIFWDNDGVLVDTEELYFSANRATFAGMGIVLTREEFLDLSLVRGTGLWPIAERSGLTRQDFDGFRARRNLLYGKMISEGSLMIDGIGEVLAKLSGRYVMGVVTSAYRHDFDVIHSSTGILNHFSFVLAGGEYEKYKPHPAPYLKAVELSGCSPDECVAVEDSPRGLASAVAAGIRCIAVPRGFTAGLDFTGAWKVLSDIIELPMALKE